MPSPLNIPMDHGLKVIPNWIEIGAAMHVHGVRLGLCWGISIKDETKKLSLWGPNYRWKKFGGAKIKLGPKIYFY